MLGSSCVSVSLSFIMAGTGDLDCLRLFRALRWKVDDVNYGSHLAASMSIGAAAHTPPTYPCR